MPRVVRETLISVRDLLIAWGPFFVIGVALLIAAYFLLDPNPPRHVILATGPDTLMAATASLREFTMAAATQRAPGTLSSLSRE